METKNYLIALILLIASTVSATLYAQDKRNEPYSDTRNALQVTLAKHPDPLKADAGVIVVTVRNITDTALYLPKAFTPLYTPQDHLMNKVFNVFDGSGKEATFIGRFIRQISDNPSVHYGRIGPGQAISHEVDLAADYDLSKGGHYQVSYQQRFVRQIRQNKNAEVVSPEEYAPVSSLDIWISASLVIKKSTDFLHPLADETSQVCPKEKQEIIDSAKNNVLPWTNKAKTHLNNLYYNEKSISDSGETIYSPKIKQDDIYEEWFGIPDNNTPAKTFLGTTWNTITSMISSCLAA